jgi:hypothetical protein
MPTSPIPVSNPKNQLNTPTLSKNWALKRQRQVADCSYWSEAEPQAKSLGGDTTNPPERVASFWLLVVGLLTALERRLLVICCWLLVHWQLFELACLQKGTRKMVLLMAEETFSLRVDRR